MKHIQIHTVLVIRAQKCRQRCQQSNKTNTKRTNIFAQTLPCAATATSSFMPNGQIKTVNTMKKRCTVAMV